ncbi:hypothetical protein [Aliikangiella sp. IMCC44359]|uniref:hypothetical protein n=1 Tax=Aliikangiella sp. IMCC44359 TaxID=3459125 RepID=UPI00403A83E9
MLPSCKKVAEELSENIDQPITGIRGFKLKLHLLMCRFCRRYDKQINLSTKTINLVEPKSLPSPILRNKLLKHYRQCYKSYNNKPK